MKPQIYYDYHYGRKCKFSEKFSFLNALKCMISQLSPLTNSLQFPTLPEIFSFRMFPLLTLLCFQTYVMDMHILYKKRIHPTILRLKY
jgi:cellulose synthase/poly-beta-1,6-N-acetylglucosamine synthase-like glycosyltransferase